MGLRMTSCFRHSPVSFLSSSPPRGDGEVPYFRRRRQDPLPNLLLPRRRRHRARQGLAPVGVGGGGDRLSPLRNGLARAGSSGVGLVPPGIRAFPAAGAWRLGRRRCGGRHGRRLVTSGAARWRWLGAGGGRRFWRYAPRTWCRWGRSGLGLQISHLGVSGPARPAMVV